MNLLGAILALPVGAVVGSFAVTAGLRWARGEQALSGRSRCDGCATPLGYGATVPIVSYVRLGGACACCRAPIHRGHFVGEVLGAVLAMVSVATLPIGSALAAAALGLVLIAAAAADAVVRRLPDLASLAVAILGVGLSLLRGPEAVLAGLVAGVLTGGALLLLRRGFAARRGDPGLGLGDVKLAIALALWLGAATPWAVALAGLFGLLQVRVAKPADGRIAFGPVLAASGWVVGLALQAGLFGDLIP
ncbi:prepilin peptidase [Caulobacter soli]|uniref:prepilin peptidase n=1 Tax=Caulobacter soli TaxID=2708539 RepID=UPI0013EC3B26|nr:A24 family peptidase [Caulobacter soli]